MKAFASGDHIVPWSKIEFDLGPIQNGWRLGLDRKHTNDSRWTVTIYRENKPWGIEEAKVWPVIKDEEGKALPVKYLESRVPDYFRIEYDFTMPTAPGIGRGWGTFEVRIDGEPQSIPIPSSLFRTGHDSVVAH